MLGGAGSYWDAATGFTFLQIQGHHNITAHTLGGWKQEVRDTQKNSRFVKVDTIKRLPIYIMYAYIIQMVFNMFTYMYM